MPAAKAKSMLLLYFAVPPKVNLEDRRYDYRKHLRLNGYTDDNAVICKHTWGNTAYLFVEALKPFLKVLKLLPYRLKEAKKVDNQLIFTFADNDSYDLDTVKVQDRGSMPARILEALMYFAFEGYGVKEFNAKRNGDVEIIMEEFYTDYESGYATNGAGYMMVTALLNGLDENKYSLQTPFELFENKRKKRK